MSENTGQGSSGSWRDDKVDSTQNHKSHATERHLETSTTAAFGRKRSCDHEAYQPIGVRAQRRQAAAARKHRNLKPMRFVSLHHHTTFSFLDGFHMPEAHVRRATEINMGAIAWTEHGNIFSHVKGEKAALAAGVKPIFGCEIYMGWTSPKKRSQRKNHLTVLAKDEVGYRNLLTLITRSWAEGFYYEPTVNPRWLVEHKEGLIILSGCQGSALFTALVGGKLVPEDEASYERGLEVARWFHRHFGDNYFIEVQAFPELEKTRIANPMLARIAEAIGRPLVADMDVHYTAPEESEVQAVLHATRPGEKLSYEDQVRSWGYDVPLCPPPTDKAIYRRLRGTGLTKEQAAEAIIQTELIGQECNVTLPRLPRVQFPVPEGYVDVREFWRHKLREGWRYRRCHKLPKRERQRYKDQLKREMEIIEAKEYENYFMIVADAIVFAKDEDIPVGPARGSAAASLCCYLLRITEVDPMRFDNLVFERFIDWSREDLPDIDIDFATYGRPIVRDYLVAKYGEECVSNIGTFTGYKSKNSLDDAGFVHRVPKGKVETVKELLLERSSGDLRASATIEDTVDQFEEAAEVFREYPGLAHAMDLEGNYKGFGVHAAGLVISNGPITEVTPVLQKQIEDKETGELRTIKAVGMDKYDAERQGLEKLDFLSLKTMDMIAEALRQLDMSLEDLYAIPLDDEPTIQGFRENDVVGVFQFTGRATRTVNGALKPDNINEIINVGALSRPGPLHNGAAQAYIALKFGEAEHETIHPALDDITAGTKYQIIFQEQILRIVREIGGFDWTHAAYIRKIISQKLGDAEFNRQIATFMEGATTIHERTDYPPMDPATAKAIWGLCITAGSYAFNAAHATAYGTIGYWCMWLKRHHPEVFYAASLSKMPEKTDMGKVDNHANLRRDAWQRPKKASDWPHEEGIQSLPPDPTAPTISWVAEDAQTIRAGIADLKGFGHKKARVMLDWAEDNEPEGWADYLAVPGVGAKTVATLEAFTESPDPFGTQLLDEALEGAREALRDGLPGPAGKLLPEPSHTAAEVLEATGGNVVFLGMPVHRNLRDIFEANRSRTGEALKEDEVDRPDLNEWVMMMCQDADEVVSLCFPRKSYPRFRRMIWQEIELNKDLVLVEGRKGGRMGSTMGQQSGLVYVTDMWVLSAQEGDEEGAHGS